MVFIDVGGLFRRVFWTGFLRVLGGF